MSKGKLIVISGPSGSGKGSVIRELLKKDKNLVLSVSMTTRAPRPGETDGVEYCFVSKEEFEKEIRDGNLIEYTVYSQNYYGTPKNRINELQNGGYDVLLDIEVEGAGNVKKAMMENLTTVFLAPPSVEELRRRLEGRGTEKPEVIDMRMERALEELKFKDKYDYIVVNDRLDKAVEEIYSIIKNN